MQAIELSKYGGFDSLRVIDTERPEPAANEILIEVKAAGVNFAELELTKGKYKIPKTPPFIMGFEAAGVVVEIGSQVRHVRVGDRVTSLVSSGGYAEYATADANAAIPIPPGISFAEATTIPVQGVSAYCLLKQGANVKPMDSLLIQAAAGGVGLYLVQLAKIATRNHPTADLQEPDSPRISLAQLPTPGDRGEHSTSSRTHRPKQTAAVCQHFLSSRQRASRVPSVGRALDHRKGCTDSHQLT
jgi:NADPH:quinone reductase-like Zn-dependent oxidoreductase